MPDIDRIYEAQLKNRAAVAATTAAQRIEKLRRIERAVLQRRNEIRASMWDDFLKPAEEVDLSEVFAIVSEARYARRRLKGWMRPHRALPTPALLGTSSRIVYEPKGIVLVIAPWNFPFNLTLGPMVSAVAAGNCVILKPSEMTPASSAAMKRFVGDLFPENEVAVIEGGPDVASDLLKRRFDHIFFTGSPAVGRIVMKAAAEHLTPVTLELGGKSPAIVDRTADLGEAATRLGWGKFLNSGQVCIAPDYLLVHEEVRNEFVEKLKRALETFGTHSGLVVNERHASRVKGLFDSAVAAGAEVIAGGEFEGRAIKPTVIGNVGVKSKVMEEEIFGPVLPIVTYGSIPEALQFIREREKPLALYLFSRDRHVIREVLSGTTAGGTVINHTLIHFYQLNLPFGGVGQSGMGRGHGFYGFQTFSNARAVLEQRLRFSGIDLLFPPYSALKRKLIDFTIRYL